jgi:hypothetical protein
MERLGDIPGIPVIGVKSFVDPDELKKLLGPYFAEFKKKGG